MKEGVVMNNFNIIKLHNEPYNYLIIATTYRSSLSNLDELKNAIDIDYGKVLFDFMLVNGNKKNRFIECEVVNSDCKRNTFRLAESVDEYIKKTSSQFFIQHKELVSGSVLPNALKYLITTGDVV
ncbi:type II toxin-antitoxin system RnlB family antitoxin [Clostridium algidicarnis]|uniref:Type II toxin-antitoxin system RnlB family antitoxin n=1 Tax=Clostridium algidicarnis TaxID=37659 RepID=A0ABS6C6H8_9CLOT|nr:type II toxin-antitoxin system RnlB family antitoxin [Clostridium algidicarnis]MBU3221102.1 type II toxin-antitoxin system RnlB family antitoxin [Clostridium algidicarnis]